MTTSIFFWCLFLLATLAYRMRPGLLFFLAAFPGTLTHELSHYLAALALKGKPQSISLIPRREGDVWVLGSVSFYPTWWNGSFIALAPAVLVPLSYWIGHLALGSESVNSAILGYLAGCTVNSGVPSRADWGIAFRYPAGMLVLFGIIALKLQPLL